jgi:murein DD-endopeptidase MepM/ murein hydrolase activator NlpD
LPERRRRLPRPTARRISRVAAHLAVIGLVALSAGFGFSKLQQTSTPNGLALDLVDTARAAATGQIEFRSAHFDLQPNTESTDPILSRRAFPTAKPTPAPTAKPPAKPKPAPVLAAAPRPVAPIVGSGKLLWPVPGGTISQYFWSGHLAIDIEAPAGSRVLAADGGTVVWAGWKNTGGGLVIEIDHGNGMHTGYNHLGSIAVSVGQVVARGQRIAAVGCTGLCTGPHLHFQVFVGGILVNPLRFL